MYFQVVLYAHDCSCIDKSMHIVLKRGSIDNPLTFNNGLYTKKKNKEIEVGMLLPKKELIQVGVGKINNYCEDIYIPPYNTH